jgi:hypothetical protein
MNPDLICTKTAADKIGIHYLKFLNRGKILKIKPEEKHRAFYWTNEQIKKIALYEPNNKKRKQETNKFNPAKIKIVELFLSQNNNSCIEIAKQTNQNLSFVNNTVNEFIKTKQITVESKMNL